LPFNGVLFKLALRQWWHKGEEYSKHEQTKAGVDGSGPSEATAAITTITTTTTMAT